MLQNVDKRLKSFLCQVLSYVSTGRKFKGKGKGNKAAPPAPAKGKVQFQGKKTKFGSDDEHNENDGTGMCFPSLLVVSWEIIYQRERNVVSPNFCLSEISVRG